jgi:carbonic anhydrase
VAPEPHDRRSATDGKGHQIADPKGTVLMSTPSATPDAEANASDAAGTAPDAAPSGRAAALGKYLPGRREALFLLGGSVLGGTFAGGAWGASAMGAASAETERDDEDKLTSREALTRLVAGNARFVAGAPVHPDQAVERRAALREGQHPFAAVLSCADSRVPPELLFDQGLGDLFVVRSAGQVLDHAVLGSLQYGIAELEAPLLVVLGHTRCGAVKATVEMVETHAAPTGTDIDALVAAIRPAVEEAEEVGATEKNLVSVSIDMNVERVVERLKTAPVLSAASKLRKVKIVGATYDVSTGRVEWL